MKIKSITNAGGEIGNLSSNASVEFDVDKNIIVVYGDNESGKSSWFSALRWLYSNNVRQNRRRGRAPNMNEDDAFSGGRIVAEAAQISVQLQYQDKELLTISKTDQNFTLQKGQGATKVEWKDFTLNSIGQFYRLWTMGIRDFTDAFTSGERYVEICKAIKNASSGLDNSIELTVEDLLGQAPGEKGDGAKKYYTGGSSGGVDTAVGNLRSEKERRAKLQGRINEYEKIKQHKSGVEKEIEKLAAELRLCHAKKDLTEHYQTYEENKKISDLERYLQYNNFNGPIQSLAQNMKNINDTKVLWDDRTNNRPGSGLKYSKTLTIEELDRLKKSIEQEKDEVLKAITTNTTNKESITNTLKGIKKSYSSINQDQAIILHGVLGDEQFENFVESFRTVEEKSKLAGDLLQHKRQYNNFQPCGEDQKIEYIEGYLGKRSQIQDTAKSINEHTRIIGEINLDEQIKLVSAMIEAQKNFERESGSLEAKRKDTLEKDDPVLQTQIIASLIFVILTFVGGLAFNLWILILTLLALVYFGVAYVKRKKIIAENSNYFPDEYKKLEAEINKIATQLPEGIISYPDYLATLQKEKIYREFEKETEKIRKLGLELWETELTTITAGWDNFFTNMGKWLGWNKKRKELETASIISDDEKESEKNWRGFLKSIGVLDDLCEKLTPVSLQEMKHSLETIKVNCDKIKTVVWPSENLKQVLASNSIVPPGKDQCSKTFYDNLLESIRQISDLITIKNLETKLDDLNGAKEKLLDQMELAESYSDSDIKYLIENCTTDKIDEANTMVQKFEARFEPITDWRNERNREAINNLDYRNEITRLESELSQKTKENGGLETELKKIDCNNELQQCDQQIEAYKQQIKVGVCGFLQNYLAAWFLQQAKISYMKNNQTTNAIACAGNVLQKITDAYSEIIIDNSANTIAIKRADNTDLLQLNQLSTGTLEQVLLAVRLGYAKSILDEITDPLPMIFDDVFANYDENRLKRSVKYLMDLSQRVQIIFFTCHKHVVEAFQNADKNNDIVIEIKCL